MESNNRVVELDYTFSADNVPSPWHLIFADRFDQMKLYHKSTIGLWAKFWKVNYIFSNNLGAIICFMLLKIRPKVTLRELDGVWLWKGEEGIVVAWLIFFLNQMICPTKLRHYFKQ